MNIVGKVTLALVFGIFLNSPNQATSQEIDCPFFGLKPPSSDGLRL